MRNWIEEAKAEAKIIKKRRLVEENERLERNERKATRRQEVLLARLKIFHDCTAGIKLEIEKLIQELQGQGFISCGPEEGFILPFDTTPKLLAKSIPYRPGEYQAWSCKWTITEPTTKNELFVYLSVNGSDQLEVNPVIYGYGKIEEREGYSSRIENIDELTSIIKQWLVTSYIDQ